MLLPLLLLLLTGVATVVESGSSLVSSCASVLAMVVLVGNANAAVRVCKMKSNAKSTPEIEVENIMNR